MNNLNDYASYRVLAGRIRMNVLDWEGNNPTVLFLHSFTANALAALPLGNLLAGQYRLIAPDLRGRGQSDIPFSDYGLNIHVRDIIACMDRLELEQCVFTGHSFGAMIALLLAAEYPDRTAGLILLDGGTVLSEQAVEALGNYYDKLQYHYASDDDYVNKFRHLPLYQPFTPELELLIRSNLYQQPDGTYIRHVPRYVVNAERRPENIELWQQLPNLYNQIHCPVLIVRAGMGVTGKEDQALNDTIIQTMQSAMPHSTLVTLEEAGHTSILTVPSRDRDNAILDFLRLIN